jgi:hypothetical protein
MKSSSDATWTKAASASSASVGPAIVDGPGVASRALRTRRSEVLSIAVTKFKALLLVLGLVAFVVGGATLLHAHASAESAVWNAEHDLSLMAALASAASLVDTVPVVILVLTFAVAAHQRSGWIEGQALLRSASFLRALT